MYGIYDLLSEPTRDPNHLCQCCSLRMKKTALVLSLFACVIAASVLEWVLIERFSMPMHWLVEVVLFVLEIAGLLLLVYAIFPEKRMLVLPLAFVQALRVLTYVICIIVYVVRIVQNKSRDVGGDIGNSIILPGVPSPGLGDTSATYGHTNAYYGKIIGHLLLEAAIRLIFIYIVYAIYCVFTARHLNGPSKYQSPNVRSSRAPPHNIVVLEQHVDEALQHPDGRRIPNNEQMHNV